MKKRKDTSLSDGESANEFFTQLAWSQLWNKDSDYYLPGVITSGIDKDGVKVDSLGDLSVGQVPSSGSFQIMKSDNLATWLPVKTGYVGIVFNTVTTSSLANVTDGGLTYTDVSDTEGKIVAKINTPSIKVSGDYTLVATGLAECALDTAASIPAIPTLSATEQEGLTDDSTPTSDDYVAAAQDQRTKLWQTPNGGQFMDMYYDHNEAFNYAFQNNDGLKNSWAQPANQHFMGTTYNSSQDPDGDPVNTGTAPDGTEYNTNAFNQQVAVGFAAFSYSLNPPADSNLTKQQWSDAANAAQSFKSIVAQTGNVSGQPAVGLNVNQVYTTVGDGDPSSPEILEAKRKKYDYKSFMAQLTKQELEYLKKIGRDARTPSLKGSDQDANATILTGSFTVEFSSGALTMGATLDFNTEPTLKATADVTDFKSSIIVENVDITDQSEIWGALPSIGTELIDSYNKSGQIKSLMQDKINAELGSDELKTYISNWLNNTLQKVFGDFS